MKSKTVNNIMQIAIALPSIVGSLLVANLSNDIQLIGWICFVVADIIGILFCIRNDFVFLFFQFVCFLIFAIIGIMNRI